MTDLIPFTIILRERIDVDGRPFIVSYAKSQTSTESKWHAVEETDDDPISVMLHVNEDVEHDYKATRGESFTPELKAMLVAEIRKTIAERE